VTTDAPAAWPADDTRIPAILDIVSKETGIERDRLLPDARIADLDIASLDFVQAIFGLESHFNIEIPVSAEGDTGEFTTVGALVSRVLGLIDESGTAA
jgi:acyl carrier protein